MCNKSERHSANSVSIIMIKKIKIKSVDEKAQNELLVPPDEVHCGSKLTSFKQFYLNRVCVTGDFCSVKKHLWQNVPRFSKKPNSVSSDHQRRPNAETFCSSKNKSLPTSLLLSCFNPSLCQLTFWFSTQMWSSHLSYTDSEINSALQV